MSWRILRQSLLVALVLWGLVFNVYLVGYASCGDCIPMLAQLNNLAHFTTLLGLVSFGIGTLFYRRWWLSAWLAVGAIMFGIWFGQLWLPQPTHPVNGVQLTASSYNVLGHLANPDQTFAIIQGMDADLVALEELRPTLSRRLRNELGEEYPYQATNPHYSFGLGLLSRYPFLEEPHFNINTSLRYIRAVIDVEGQAVVVYVFHPPNPKYSLGIAYDDGDNFRQIRELAGLLERETLPTLLLCDCNATPQSRQYALLNQSLNDSFRETGFGFGLTFPAYRPVIRIDYVWHSDDFVALDSKVWVDDEGGTSDHLPIWSRLVLKAK